MASPVTAWHLVPKTSTTPTQQVPPSTHRYWWVAQLLCYIHLMHTSSISVLKFRACKHVLLRLHSVTVSLFFMCFSHGCGRSALHFLSHSYSWKVILSGMIKLKFFSVNFQTTLYSPLHSPHINKHLPSFLKATHASMFQQDPVTGHSTQPKLCTCFTCTQRDLKKFNFQTIWKI